MCSHDDCATCAPMTIVHVQTSSWQLTNPSSQAVSQQAPALKMLAAAKPDELDDVTQHATVQHCSHLLEYIGYNDGASATALLTTVSTLSQHANSLVEATITGTAGGDNHTSTGGAGANVTNATTIAATAEMMFHGANAAVLTMTSSMLKGSIAGEIPVVVEVGRYATACVVLAMIDDFPVPLTHSHCRHRH